MVGVTWLTLLSSALNLTGSFSTLLWMVLKTSTKGSSFPSSPSSISMSLSCPLPTPMRAYSGHSLNQSMVVPLMREGNIRRRVAKIYPMGLMQMTLWMLRLTLARYMLKMFILLGCRFFLAQSPLQLATMSSMSLSL